MRKVLLIGAAAAAVWTSAADAASVLYRNDYVVGTDYMGQALAAGSHTVTATAGSLSGYTLSDYDLVVYANQGDSAPGGDIASLDTYLAAGGKVIFTNWETASPTLNSASAGGVNQGMLTLGAAFGDGIANPLAVVNTGWGVFARDLAALPGGTVAGTFGNGTAAIVVGNGGRSIHNGFLTDTVASQRLYSNQIASLVGAGVPEPATWALMILGFGAIGGAMRRRAKVGATVRFA